MAKASPLPRALEAKIATTRRRLFFERMWPRVWVPLGAVLVFLGLSVFDVWPLLPVLAHQALLGLLGLAAVAGIVLVLRTDYPSRDDAVRHLDANSHVPHRPASTASDTLSATSDDPAGQAIWAAHQRRMADEAKRLRVAAAKPRTDRFDPLALRAAAILLVALGAGLAGQTIPDRVRAAFDLGQTAAMAARARLDAWITPPGYTSRPAIILANGGRGANAQARLTAPGLSEETVSAPEKSTVTVRTSRDASGKLVLRLFNADDEMVYDSAEAEAEAAKKAAAAAEEAAAKAEAARKTAEANGTPASDTKPRTAVTAQAPKSDTTTDPATAIQSVTASLERDVTRIVALLGGSEARTWDVTITPDKAPTIAQTKPHEATRRGAMKLFYQVQDDFGVASAEARFVALPPDEEDPRTQWARPEALKGPRLPLARPPQITLRLPGRRSKDGKTWSFHDIGSHPWAGMRVRMTLVAKDHAGNVGRSAPVDMRLPQRQFSSQFAKAVIEQRRNLVIDDRYTPIVRKALDALVLEPEGFISDLGVYTGLRSAYHRLARPPSRPGLDETIRQLWHLAVRIQDGKGLSAAERRLRELQKQLSEAIQKGASDEEIRRLMQELRQALAEFMRQLAQQGQQMPQQNGQNQQNQTLSQRDLEQMLQNLENMARQGSKDQAQEMLSQLRDLIDRMQSGRMAQNGQQGQQSQQQMQALNKFGDIIGQQQRLMDDTHGQQRQGGQQGQQGQQGQRGQPGQRGQGQRGQGKQQGQRGQGQQGQGQQGQGQRGQGQRGQGQQQGQGGQRGQAQRGQGGQNGRSQQPGSGNGQAQNQGPSRGQGTLSDRQAQLGQMLDELQNEMNGLGMRGPAQMDGARDSMEAARRALENGDLDEATREQARALEQLRQGAQSMAQRMLQRMPGRYGRAGDAPLDPLGRPQRTEGPDNGSTVKVPGEIETQRAREILEELRRRLGQPQRPEVELDYIERLLERF